jgi:uncharacterized delta-60 repeat protein
MILSARFKRMELLLGGLFLALPGLLMAQAGSLDPTFGTNGIVTTSGTSAVGAALQSDGKILVAGTSSSGAAVFRYNTNGTLDSTFGTAGQVTLNNDNSGPAFAVAVQGDGKILIAAPDDLSLGIFRLETNGSLDTSFGSNGVAVISGTGGIFLTPANGQIVPQTDGKILVITFSSSLGDRIFERLLSDGTPDSTFGTNGAAVLLAGSAAMTLQSSGKILVLAAAPTIGGAVARYETNGSLDATFGAAGQSAGFGNGAGIALIETSGKFIIGGSIVTAPSTEGGTTSFLVNRYTANGNIDTTFGTNGSATATFPNNGFSTVAGVALQSNGEIVAGGLTAPSSTSLTSSSFALARFTASGTLDTTFGTNGLVTTTIGTKGSAINTLLIQADGKILAFGNNNGETTIARYLSQ